MKFISAIQIVFITVLISISLGCVKKRPDQWSQGQGRNLEAISLLDGKTFSVSTGKSINKTNSASTVKPIVESSVTEFNFFDLVEYNAPQATLLPENIEFRGRENTTSTYKIKYWIDDSYLKVLKVGKKEDIPIQEMDYAIKLDNDEFGVPLVGYKVEHIQRVAYLNGDNEKTHQ